MHLSREQCFEKPYLRAIYTLNKLRIAKLVRNHKDSLIKLGCCDNTITPQERDSS